MLPSTLFDISPYSKQQHLKLIFYVAQFLNWQLVLPPDCVLETPIVVVDEDNQ